MVTLNEQPVYQLAGPAGSPDSEVARCSLKKGRNRILVLSRAGAGSWRYGVQIGLIPPPAKEKPAVASIRKK